MKATTTIVTFNKLGTATMNLDTQVSANRGVHSEQELESSQPLLMPALLLFVGSGAAALIYEVVWFQLLQFVIGSSSLSLGVLLATFMGGMGLGSWLYSRVVPCKWHPLAVYAVLELLIGLLGLAIVFLMPLASRWYLEWVQGHQSGVAVRCILAASCLLPPTLCMGATLPAIARWMQTTPSGVSRMGLFYAANIAGAVCGCLLAGFYLLRVYSLEVTTAVALAINLIVAAIGWSMSRIATYQPSVVADADKQVVQRQGTHLAIYLAIGLSGLTALGAEVLWTRALSLMLGATVYSFSLILAVFLIGLGLGSHVGSGLAAGKVNPRLLFGVFQTALIGCITWAAWALYQWLPYWPIDVSLSKSHWLSLQLDITRSLFAMLPAAFCWGASFPLAIASVSRPGQDPGRLVGGIYAANTLGAIGGALLFSALFIPWMGTQNAHRVLLGLVGCSSLIVLVPVLYQTVVHRTTSRTVEAMLWGSVVSILIANAAGWAALTAPEIPPGLIGYGRYLPTYEKLPNFVYWGEGSNASIAVSEESDGTRNFHVSGKVVASSNPFDMRLQRLLSHLPALVHPEPKTVLVVGCGAGVTAGTFLTHPSIERIVICEIEALIPPAAGKQFGAENNHVIDDPRVEIVIDDARHYIATTKEKFDIITSDPIHPWVKGAATLYSQEYFELTAARLNPGGVVTQWVPLYETSPEAANSQIGTFMKAFPHGTIWGTEANGGGYHLVLMAQIEPTKIDFLEWEQRLNRRDHQHVQFSLAEIGLGTIEFLLKTYAGRAADLNEWIEPKYINQDHHLRLQYLAGVSLNRYDEDQIYRSILKHRCFPEDLMVVPEPIEVELRRYYGLRAR